MFFEVEWIEDEVGVTRRVFRARDFGTLYKAIKYMNAERQYKKRPVMRGIQIKTLEKCDGEYSDITGKYDADMALDAERRMV